MTQILRRVLHRPEQWIDGLLLVKLPTGEAIAAYVLVVVAVLLVGQLTSILVEWPLRDLSRSVACLERLGTAVPP